MTKKNLKMGDRASMSIFKNHDFLIKFETVYMFVKAHNLRLNNGGL